MELCKKRETKVVGITLLSESLNYLKSYSNEIKLQQQQQQLQQQHNVHKQ